MTTEYRVGGNDGQENNISITRFSKLTEKNKNEIKIFIRRAIRDYAVQNNLESRIGKVLTSDLIKTFIEQIVHIFATTSADKTSLSVNSGGNLRLSQSRDGGNEISFESYELKELISSVPSNNNQRLVIPEQHP